MPDHGPPVTVLMSVYNGVPYLAEAIESVLVQSFDDFEFLIIDDASTDGSKDLVQSYGDPRIRLINNESNLGRGQTRALNYGLRLARGEYIARLDSDDIALPHRLERQVSYMAQHPQVVLLGTWCQFIDEVGNLVGCFHPPTSHQAIIDATATINPFAHSAVLFRRAPVMEMGGYPANYLYAQDFALWLRLSRRYQLANLPEEHVQIRQHARQLTNSPDMRTAMCQELMHLIQQALVHPDLSSQARKAGRRQVARATVNYAVALSQEGRHRATLRLVSRVCLRYPHVCTAQMMWLLLGRRGRELVRSIVVEFRHYKGRLGFQR